MIELVPKEATDAIPAAATVPHTSLALLKSTIPWLTPSASASNAFVAAAAFVYVVVAAPEYVKEQIYEDIAVLHPLKTTVAVGQTDPVVHGQGLYVEVGPVLGL